MGPRLGGPRPVRLGALPDPNLDLLERLHVGDKLGDFAVVVLLGEGGHFALDPSPDDGGDPAVADPDLVQIGTFVAGRIPSVAMGAAFHEKGATQRDAL